MGSHSTQAGHTELSPVCEHFWKRAGFTVNKAGHSRNTRDASYLVCLHFPSSTHGETSLFDPMVLHGFSRVDTNKWLFMSDGALTIEEMIPPEGTNERI